MTFFWICLFLVMIFNDDEKGEKRTAAARANKKAGLAAQRERDAQQERRAAAYEKLHPRRVTNPFSMDNNVSLKLPAVNWEEFWKNRA